MLSRRVAWTAGCVMALLLVAGCGDGLGEVSGTITFDGKPIEAGSITFEPVDGKAVTAGKPFTDGRYTVPGVPAGPMKVRITGTKVLGKRKAYPNNPNSPEIIDATELLPKKYNADTELRYDVTPGKNEKNFELSSK